MARPQRTPEKRAPASAASSRDATNSSMRDAGAEIDVGDSGGRVGGAEPVERLSRV